MYPYLPWIKKKGPPITVIVLLCYLQLLCIELFWWIKYVVNSSKDHYQVAKPVENPAPGEVRIEAIDCNQVVKILEDPAICSRMRAGRQLGESSSFSSGAWSPSAGPTPFPVTSSCLCRCHHRSLATLSCACCKWTDMPSHDRDDITLESIVDSSRIKEQGQVYSCMLHSVEAKEPVAGATARSGIDVSLRPPI